MMNKGLGFLLNKIGYNIRMQSMEEDIIHTLDNKGMTEDQLKFLKPITKYYNKAFKMGKKELVLDGDGSIHKDYYERFGGSEKYGKFIYISMSLPHNATYDVHRNFPRINTLSDVKSLKDNYFIFEAKKFSLLFFNRVVYVVEAVPFVSRVERIENIMEAFKYILTIQHFFHKEIITEEILQSIKDDRFINNDIFSQGIIEEIARSIGSFSKIDYEKEIEEKTSTKRSLMEENRRRHDSIMEAERNYERVILEIEAIDKTILKYIQLYEENETKDDDEQLKFAEIIKNQIKDHFLVESLAIVASNKNRVVLRIRTKPNRISVFNQSPEGLLKGWVQNGALPEMVSKAYMDAYEARDRDQDGDWQIWVQPTRIDIEMRLEANNHSGLSFRLMDIYDSDTMNPHRSYSCFGNYKNHLAKSLAEGEIGRYLTLFKDYLSSVTIGDTAGNKLPFTTRLAVKGEDIQWNSTNLRIVQRREEELRQEELLKRSQEVEMPLADQ